MLVGQAADRGSGGEELGGVLAPDVVGHRDVDPDDPGGAGLGGLGLHAGQGQFAGLVDALGELIISWFWPAWRSVCITDWCAMW